MKIFNNEILTTNFLHNKPTIKSARAVDQRTSKRILYLWSPHIQKQPVLGEVCSVRGSPTTQWIDAFLVAVKKGVVVLCVTFLADDLLYAKAMACDGRMDDSNPLGQEDHLSA